VGLVVPNGRQHFLSPPPSPALILRPSPRRSAIMTSGWRGEIGQAGSRSGQVRWVPLPPGYEAGTAAVGGFQSEQAAAAPPVPSPASGCGLACGLKNATKDPTRPIALARLCLTFYNAGLPAPGRSLANAASSRQALQERSGSQRRRFCASKWSRHSAFALCAASPRCYSGTVLGGPAPLLPILAAERLTCRKSS
jgi:hypothetical protein